MSTAGGRPLTIQTVSDGLRFYCGLPLTREPTDEQMKTLRQALNTATVDTPRSKEAQAVDPVGVTIGPEFALVEFQLAADAWADPTDVAGALQGAITDWHREYAPFADYILKGGAREVGTAPAEVLDLADGDDTITKRLEAKAAGETPETEASLRFYEVLVPRRPLTDEEVRAVEHVAEQPLAATAEYVALFDRSTPGISFYDANDYRALQTNLRTIRSRADVEDLLDKFFFKTRYQGSLPTDGVDEATIREAVHDRAATVSPHETGDGPDADASEVNA